MHQIEEENDSGSLVMGSHRDRWPACVRQCTETRALYARSTWSRIVARAVFLLALINYCYYSAGGLFECTIITVVYCYGIASIRILLNVCVYVVFFYNAYSFDYAIESRITYPYVVKLS